jgi:phosphonate transport system substrate-binding protein
MSTRRLRLIGSAAAAVVLSVTLAACGSSSSGSAGTSSTSAAAAAATSAVAAGTSAAGASSAAAAPSADSSTGGAAVGDGTGTFAQDSDTLVFGVVPDTASTQANYQPLMDYIAKVSGKKVAYKQSSDYSALIAAAVAGKVDIASFSGFTYVTAKNKGAAISPISSIITKKGEDPGYYSEAIVPTNSTITDIAGMKGKKVCFVDPSSTSGYLFPTYNLLKAGVNPKTDITPVFAGTHDASAQKVADGTECDAGFAEDSVADNQKGVKVIQKTKVPGAPVVVSDALPASVKTELTKDLSNVTIDQIAAAGIANADSQGFKETFYALSPVDDKYYDQIRDICKTTQAKQCQG